MLAAFENRIPEHVVFSCLGEKRARAEVVAMTGKEAEVRSANEVVNVRGKKAKAEKGNVAEVKNADVVVPEVESVVSEAVTEVPSKLLLKKK